MTNLQNLDGVARKQRILRIGISMLMILYLFATTFSLTTITASAAGGVEFDDVLQIASYLKMNSVGTDGAISIGDLGETYSSNTNTTDDSGGSKKSVEDWKTPDLDDDKLVTKEDIPTWDQLTKLAGYQNKIASGFPNVKRCCTTASQIVNTFGESTAYQKATADLKGLSWTYEPTLHTLEPVSTNDQHALDNAVSKFKSSAASAAANTAFGSIYDSQNWNPSAGVAGDVLQSIYGVINVAFYFIANCTIWFFLLQTGCDVLYILAEPIRPFIAPYNSGSSGSMGNNGSGGFLSKFRIPICTTEVEQACNGGSGRLGGNSAGGAGAGNAFLSYGLKRFPVLICCAVYLILVTLGYWPKLISWISGFAIEIIDFFLRLGQ